MCDTNKLKKHVCVNIKKKYSSAVPCQSITIVNISSIYLDEMKLQTRYVRFKSITSATQWVQAPNQEHCIAKYESANFNSTMRVTKVSGAIEALEVSNPVQAKKAGAWVPGDIE